MKLSIKFGILITLLMTTLIGSLIAFVDIDIQKSIRSEHREKIAMLGKAISNEVANPLLNKRLLSVQEIINAHKKQIDYIEYIFVMDFEGSVLAHTFGEGFPNALFNANAKPLFSQQSTESMPVSAGKGRLSDNVFPIVEGMDTELHIGIDEGHIQNAINKINRKVITVGAFFIILGGMLSFIMGYWIVRHVQNVVRAMDAIGDGNLGHRIEISTNDEIGKLADSFNAMAEKRKVAEDEREKRIAELKEAIAKIKTLSGMLPICASCNKIRDDNDNWHQIEYYISEHSEAEFSHGICPECAKKIYPEYYK